MATVIKDLGAVTAYAYAVEGGYTGTEEEFAALLGNIADDLSQIENLSVTVTTLPAGSSATASYSNGVLALGIPKGDKGDKGDTGATPAFTIGTVTTLAAGNDASASITGTAAAPVLNLGIPKGADGDVSSASMATAYSTSATYAVGDYVWYSGQLYCCTTAISTAESWTAAHWTAVKLAEDVGNLKSAFNSYLYGLDKQYPVVGDDYYEIPLQLIKGKTYTITNKTTAACTVNVKKTDGTTTSISTALIVNGSVSFTPSTDEYIGIRGWSNAAGYIQIVCDYSDVEQTVKLSNLNNISIFSGYIASDGSIGTPDTTRQEVYTEKISIDVGYTFDFNLEYAEAKAMWFAYAIYNSAGTFIERITLDAGITRTSHNYSFTISNANAKFVAFTFRSYGIASFAINTPDVTKVLNNKIVALNENFVSIYPLINKNVRSINHRGYNTVAPENTLPAYKLSKRMGFDYAECDISFTSDGVAVLLHDGTINRTARNADGTELSTSISISSITYEQALQYDFGIWKGAEYAGTKIPTFTQFIQLCKRIGLSAYVELKPTGTTEARVRGLIDTVKNCGMTEHVTWISFYPALLTYVKNYDSTARIGLVTESITAETVQTAENLKTTENEVFIDADVYNDTVVNLCASANIPLEVWTINSAATMQSLNAYITGATSDLLIFGKALYDAYIN